MFKNIRYKLADVILPNDHVIIRNFYRSAPLYIEFQKGIDYTHVHSQDSTSSQETSSEQLQASGPYEASAFQ